MDYNTKERLVTFSLATIAGIGLSVASMTATGNAVGNLMGSSQGLFGIFLFVFGLAGLAFGFNQ